MPQRLQRYLLHLLLLENLLLPKLMLLHFQSYSSCAIFAACAASDVFEVCAMILYQSIVKHVIESYHLVTSI